MIITDSTPTPFQLSGVTAPAAGGLPAVFTPSKLDAGSTGADFSTGQPALPTLGSNFAGSGNLYAGYVLLTTIPANPGRARAEIHNLSGQGLVVVRDDGTASHGAQLTNASLFVIAGGPEVGQPGVPYVSTTFKGRYQIFGPPGASPITAFAD